MKHTDGAFAIRRVFQELQPLDQLFWSLTIEAYQSFLAAIFPSTEYKFALTTFLWSSIEPSYFSKAA